MAGDPVFAIAVAGESHRRDEQNQNREPCHAFAYIIGEPRRSSRQALLEPDEAAPFATPHMGKRPGGHYVIRETPDEVLKKVLGGCSGLSLIDVENEAPNTWAAFFDLAAIIYVNIVTDLAIKGITKPNSSKRSVDAFPFGHDWHVIRKFSQHCL